MSKLIHRLRALLIALAVLALSATAALAGRSALSNPAAQAATQSGTGDEAGSGDVEEAEADEPDADAGDDADAGTVEVDAPDAEADSGPAAEHPDNHGKAVSEAARADTPSGFDHHGAYVRTVAHDNHGHGADGASTKAPKVKAKGKASGG